MAGIYVHFPFCSSRCIYCDFYSSTKRGWTGYVDALQREMALRKDFLKGVPPRTLYFGGGTPSLLPSDELARVAEALRHTFDLSSLEEFTVEVNPDDVTQEKAAALKRIGVNRVSMGVQSFCDDHLKWMGRRHTAQGAVEAFRRLREAGFANISVDLIFGFAGLSDEDWDYSVSEAIKLNPEHISCYQMMGKYAEKDEAKCERQYLYLQRRLCEAGFFQYEISNYCREGFRSRHNSAYWRRDPYLGLGAAAHSFDGDRLRCWNISDLDRYLAGDEGGGETLSDAEVAEEKVMLGLRTAEGVEESLIKTKPAAGRLTAAGYILSEDSRVRIPEEHFFVADWITSQLFD